MHVDNPLGDAIHLCKNMNYMEPEKIHPENDRDVFHTQYRILHK